MNFSFIAHVQKRQPERFNDRENVSATVLRVTSPTTISRFHTVAAIAAIHQRRCRAGLPDDEYRQDEAAE